MQAVILAAGMGKRLKELTADNTKCMVKVNGVTLIERMLHQLEQMKLNRVIIVVGYEGEKLINYIESQSFDLKFIFINNEIFDKTNNIYSLSMAKEYLLEDDTILLESDLIFEDSVLKALADDPRETLALVDKYESWMDGTCIKIGENDVIDAFIPGKKFVFEDIPYYFKTVNIYKFSKHFSETHYVPFLEAYSKALGNNEYYEQVLRVITMLDDPEIKAKKLDGQLWYEIDDIQDLDIASSMFADDNDEKVANIQSRFGGYWRYPRLLDFCYLVNPFFPPQKLMNEMKANFETLLTQYPSGMAVNSLLAAKNFAVRQEHILVGNGAAELIKCLMEKTEGKVGFIRPTFEEYPNRYNRQESVIFVSPKADFSYSIEDLMHFFDGTDIETLVLINPDNPTGNYIAKEHMLKFIEWCNVRNIRIIVDESFVDFAEENNSTLIDEAILQKYENLIVLKSISKSYGVPGLRLGVLASSDEELISNMKKEVAIWNINSFGEFYMQIEEKYKKDYTLSLEKIKQVRKQFIQNLSSIAALRVIPSQANYIMVELVNGTSSKELTRRLLLEYHLFIKDLTGKIFCDGRQFIRLAVRNHKDNEKLLMAMKEILG